jgi:hypothetical protein
MEKSPFTVNGNTAVTDNALNPGIALTSEGSVCSAHADN